MSTIVNALTATNGSTSRPLSSAPNRRKLMEMGSENSFNVLPTPFRPLPAIPPERITRYPGLESSPSKALADKQFEGNGYGGMLCVNFKGGQKEIDKLISNLQLVRFVPTLAGVGTTLTYPPRASHRDLSPDELAAIGITMGQIRLSSGLEDTDDLLNDFDQALAKM